MASQIKTHQKYGGVYPTLAKREHQKNLPLVLEQAVAFASSPHPRPARTPLKQPPALEDIDVIAVTYGPGLSPCLWAGINFAKDLAKKWAVPLVPVDHMEGHLLVGLLANEKPQFSMPNDQIFPSIALVVSGGHTQLVLVKDIGKYEIIGETRDDAAGECFDKTARILGLPYPGGPAVAAAAALADKPAVGITLPRPMMRTKDYDFSFSGLKTAVLYDYKDRPQEVRESKEYIQEMASEIQQAITDVLVHKTMKAAEAFGAKSVTLGGGVSANDELRGMFEVKLQTLGVPLLAPPKNLSTDNGAMIALAGYFTHLRDSYEKNPENIAAAPNLRID